MHCKIWTYLSPVALFGVLGAANPAAAQSDIVKAAQKGEQLGREIVKFVSPKVGQKGIGDGQCTRLVEAALAAVGAKPLQKRKPTALEIRFRYPDEVYVWGQKVRTLRGSSYKASPGFIIQFYGCRFERKNPDGSLAQWFNYPERHTSIVESAKGTRLVLVHQNVDGEPAQEKSRIRRQTLDLAWLTKGRYQIFSPAPK